MKFTPSTIESKNLSVLDHGFKFELKCMQLNRILLDHLWFQRSEGIEILEELFRHFEVMNEVNIGSGYIKKFGNPEDFFFGISTSSLEKDVFASGQSSGRIGSSSNSNEAFADSDFSVSISRDDSNFCDPLLLDLTAISCRIFSHSSLEILATLLKILSHLFTNVRRMMNLLLFTTKDSLLDLVTWVILS